MRGARRLQSGGCDLHAAEALLLGGAAWCRGGMLVGAAGRGRSRFKAHSGAVCMRRRSYRAYFRLADAFPYLLAYQARVGVRPEVECSERMELECDIDDETIRCGSEPRFNEPRAVLRCEQGWALTPTDVKANVDALI